MSISLLYEYLQEYLINVVCRMLAHVLYHMYHASCIVYNILVEKRYRTCIMPSTSNF